MRSCNNKLFLCTRNLQLHLFVLSAFPNSYQQYFNAPMTPFIYVVAPTVLRLGSDGRIAKIIKFGKNTPCLIPNGIMGSIHRLFYPRLIPNGIVSNTNKRNVNSPANRRRPNHAVRCQTWVGVSRG